MYTVLIEPASTHEMLWSLLGKHPIDRLLCSGVNHQSLTLELITSTIRTLFLSEPKDSYESPEEVLSKYINEDKLYDYCLSVNLYARETITVLDIQSTDALNAMRRVDIRPNFTEMIYQTFNEELDMFSRALLNVIQKTAKNDISIRYRFIEFDCLVDRRGRINAITLLIGDDIRDTFFKSVFGNRPYNSSVLKKLNLPPIDNGFIYNRSTGMAQRKPEH